MRRSGPDRSARLLLCLLGATAVGLSAPSTALARLALGSGPGEGVPPPAALAGRHERASVPGAYVDVHGPFSAAEARLVEGYRDPAGRPFVAPR